ncbi:MaoC/PaaZ C-terminal domain-containing protein [Natronospira bacteriovora]|uniref:MaoC/PaaZ C-terminal domain-containing protein n=1 Tax=Natronospira bacteriovora TaxID=3069753 RepID=A0ABU0W9N2_9GAMM|nr:MaoC/PaaZ C-terminal domain-containing protein [Natronospira sp. AB-CW4]MDQ2070741.1 MaoC/PaaZ C-terminal domain-containing protein [Natronospira sp. AB-CW4]
MIREQRGQPASLTRAYARLLGNELMPARGGALEADAYPLHCHAPVEIQRERVEAYRRICQLPSSGHFPALYPQIAAMPLHLQLLSTPGLPGRSLGVVHLGQTVRWHRPMGPVEERMNLSATLRPGPGHVRGQVFYMQTEWQDSDGIAIWEGESLLLFRGVDAGSDEMARLPPDTPETPEGALELDIDCPAGLGRSYARVSGDWNPIHLSSMSARLFGFQCPIVHGMWTLARALGEIERLRPQGGDFSGRQLEAWFTAPLFWPGSTCLHVSPDGDWFQVDRDRKRRRPALWGQLQSF